MMNVTTLFLILVMVGMSGCDFCSWKKCANKEKDTQEAVLSPQEAALIEQEENKGAKGSFQKTATELEAVIKDAAQEDIHAIDSEND